MPRRSTLLIVATLLILLGTPVIYLASTWSTDNPLRFEVTRSKIEGDSTYMIATMDVTVRNTSSLPVHAKEFHMKMEDVSGQSHVRLSSMERKLEDGSTSLLFPLYLPPGGSMSCEFWLIALFDAGKAREYLEAVEVDYRWKSGTVERIDELYESYVHRGPEVLRELIPRPQESRHRAPLVLPVAAPDTPHPP